MAGMALPTADGGKLVMHEERDRLEGGEVFPDRVKRVGKRRWLKRFVVGCLVFPVVVAGLLYGYNNVSLMGEEAFGRRVDEGIAGGHRWVAAHRDALLAEGKIAVFRM